MRMRALLSIFLACQISTSVAEIERIAIPNERAIQFYWWPKLAPIEGWQQDREFSFRYSVNALAPVGKSFANAETVMYAKAVFKPRVPNVKSLEALIASDRKEFLAKVPGITIADAPPLKTADGLKLISLTYTPAGEGNWERVSYLEEGEFYLIFTVSSRTASGYKSAEKSYESLISTYREKP
jgi:hypothetical protein